MKKFLVAILAAMTMMNMLGFAATDETEIADLKRKLDATGVTNGITAKVRLGLNLAVDDVVTLTMEKKKVGTADETPDEMAKRIYAVQEKVITAAEVLDEDKTWTVTVTIPELRHGLAGSGEYLLRVSTSKADSDSETFFYADKNSVNAFLTDLKIADLEPVEANRNQDLVDLMTADSTKGVMFSIGVNADDFLQASPAVQKDTMNVLHGDGIQTLDTTTFPGAFGKAFGLATYNAGDKEKGVEIFSLTYGYGGTVADAMVVPSALSLMAPTYSDTATFANGFTLAYGFATINSANINNILDRLDTFATTTRTIDITTGECADLIAQIKALDPLAARTAYTDIITNMAKNPISTSAQMKTVLKTAYDAATKPSGGHGGSGAAGNVDNAGEKSKRTFLSTPSFGTNEGEIEQTNIFTDLPKSHWAATAVQWLKSKGAVNGIDTGAFMPDRAVTREEFVKMLVAVCGFSLSNAEPTFNDLENSAWYVPYVMTAKEQGIVNGIDENTFGVGRQITRQDMTVMVKNAIKANNVSLNAVNIYGAFADDAEIADYAADAVKALFEAGIINGKGENKFEPQGNATRAEATKIIYEAFKGGV